jgi:hypothetical protein
MSRQQKMSNGVNKTITSVLIGLLLFSGVASAQTSELPSAGITPGSPFFFLERFFEGIGTFFTFGEANKARRLIAFAEERLAEAKVLSERGDSDNVERASELYEEQFSEAQERAERSRDTEALARVTEATSKHFAVLEDVIERVPEQAKESVRRALENSKQGQVAALQALSGVNPDRAVESGATVAKELASQARAHAQERKAEALEQKLQHFEGVFASFANAPQGRVDVAAKFSERLTEIVNELDEVGDEAEDAGIGRGGIERVKSVKGNVINAQLTSLEDVVAVDPAKAVEIYAQAAEGRLNAARKEAEERNGKATEESLEDYNKYAEFGQRISSMAEGIRTGETLVEDLVKEAVSHHLRVLEDVRQKLPPQAQQEFRRALDNSRRVQEQRPAIPAPGQPGIPPQREIPQRPTTPVQLQRPPQAQPEVEREAPEVEREESGAPQQIPGGPPQQIPGGRP